MEDLIKGVDRGVLVTRFWYIRSLDPQTLLLTGLTRDGLFLIEKGKVTRPVKNMRWNESPVFALNNLDAMTAPERTVSGCLLYTSPSPRDRQKTRMPSSA